MSTLKQTMLTGVFWSAVEKYSAFFISLIISAILARILSPSEYGVVTVASVIIDFFALFVSMGIGPAIIQYKDLTETDLDSIFTATLILGLVLGGVFFVSSWTIANFYDNQLLVPICQILAVNLLMNSANLVPNSLMMRDLRFKFVATRSLILQIISGIFAIIVAYYGWSVYALVIPPIFTSICVCVINLYYYPRRIDWHFNLIPLKRIFSYSIYQFLFDSVNYFSRNLDKLVIGRLMSMDALGYYDKSYRLMMMPLSKVTQVLNPVLQPVLSTLQDDINEMEKKYGKLVSILSNVSFPLAIYLLFTAYDLINIVYGNKWDLAVPAFQILTLSLPLQMILSSSGGVFQSANSTQYMFLTGIRNTFFTVSTLFIATFWFKTIEAIAWSWNISLCINFMLTYRTMYHSVFHCSFGNLLCHLTKPFISASMLFVVMLMQHCLLPISNIYLSFVVKTILAIAVTFLFIRLVMHTTPMAILKSIKS